MNAPRCRHCGEPLETLRARLHAVCRRPACLQREDARVERDHRRALAARLRDALALPPGAGAAAAVPVIWIRRYEAAAVDLPESLRSSHLAYLDRIATDPAMAEVAPAEPTPEAATPHRAESQLCAWCGGRCCRFGSEHDAYLKPAHLRRWQVDHPGSTLADAAAAYAARLPQRHVAGSCLYHGERGCTLDRDMRSEVCNRFACDGLRELQVGVTVRPQSDWLFAKIDRRELQAAVHAGADGLHPVEWTPPAAS